MSRRPLRIGIDLDNTIVCYEDVFRDLARKRGLIDGDRWPGRIGLRDELRARDLEERWTELQGEAYGAEMRAASAFAGAREFIEACARRGDAAFIVSHRTRQPYRGEPVDLHAAALAWLDARGFLRAVGCDQVFLEISVDDKVRRIAELGCTHFIDDLPELLGDARFPAQTVPILFDPNDANAGSALRRLRSWAEAEASILDGAGAR